MPHYVKRHLNKVIKPICQLSVSRSWLWYPVTQFYVVHNVTMSGSENSGSTKSSVQERNQVIQWDSVRQTFRRSQTSRLSSRSNKSTQSRAERKAKIAVLQVQREAEQRRAEVEAEQAALEAKKPSWKPSKGSSSSRLTFRRSWTLP